MIKLFEEFSSLFSSVDDNYDLRSWRDGSIVVVDIDPMLVGRLESIFGGDDFNKWKRSMSSIGKYIFKLSMNDDLISDFTGGGYVSVLELEDEWFIASIILKIGHLSVYNKYKCDGLDGLLECLNFIKDKYCGFFYKVYESFDKKSFSVVGESEFWDESRVYDEISEKELDDLNEYICCNGRLVKSSLNGYPGVYYIGRIGEFVVEIFKLMDEWYMLEMTPADNGPVLFKCDQWQGLTDCVEYIKKEYC